MKQLGLLAALGLTALSLHAQQHLPAAPLPAAPSAVLAAQQSASPSLPAGSGVVFTAPSTLPGPAGTLIEQPQTAALPLSLDDAIALGLDRNIRLRYDRANQRAAAGYNLGVFNALLPSLTFDASASAQEINLAAQGFKPNLFAKFIASGLLPPGTVIPTLVKVNTNQVQVSAKQDVLNFPDIEIYRGVKHEIAVVDLNNLTDRGDLVLAVGMSYLQVLADQSSVANALAQQRSAQTLFDQATAKHDAGVGIHLDALRAQVAFQQRQQDLIAAQSKLAKDTIQLARILGLPAGQPLALTDTAPLTQLDGMDLDAAKLTAYARRKDLLSLQEQLQVAIHELRAVKYQRLPVLAFNGYYGVLGQIGGLYHGVFTAQGTLNVPIFREASQRGEEQVVDSQLTALHQQESSLRVTIDAQIRSSMLDVEAANQLVQVSQSNVALAQQALSDAHDRFAAGVDDNLPVVDAEASLASAQSQLVQSLYSYNVAKLQLARNTGVIETRYRTYLGK